MIWTRVRARRFENSSAYTDGTSRSSAPQTMSVGAETRWIRFFNPLSGIVGTARRRDRRTRAPDVGNALDEQVQLADPGQGVEEANPSRLCANARRLGC